MATTSKVEGLAAINKVLLALPGRLAERELANAVRAGARVIQKEVIARAPHGAEPSEASKEFGPLHKKIKVRRVKPRSRLAASFAIRAEVPYAAHVEFGTVKTPARPFMSTALDVSAQAAIEKVRERLVKGVEKVAAELAGKFGSLRKATRRRL